MDDLGGNRSKGATTARAVLVMRELDEEIREETDDEGVSMMWRRKLPQAVSP